MWSSFSRRRLFASTTIGLGVTAIGAACSPAGTGDRATGAASVKAPVSLTLWDREDAGFKQYMDAWTPLFEAKNQHVKLSFSPRPPDWGPKLTASIVGGTPPDSIAVFGSWYRNLQEAKQAVPLDTYIKSSRLDVSDFLQGSYQGMKFGGQQIGIPQYVNTNAVYYNRDLFKKAGATIPDNWTHDQFLAAANQLTTGSLPVRDVWGLFIRWDLFPARVDSLIWGQCGSYNAPNDPTIFTFNSPQNAKAFQWAYDIVWKYRYGGVSDEEMGGRPGRDAFFLTGRAAMLLDGMHLLGTYKSTAQVDWDVAPLPKGPCGVGQIASMDGYIIPVGAKSPDASWTLVQAITDKQANQMRAEIVGIVPARKSQMESWTKTVPGKSLKYAIADDAGHADPSALWPKSNDVLAAVLPIWQALFVKNQLTVPDALKKMNDAVVGVLGASAVR